MKLRCQLKGIKCPRYKHQGIFYSDDETIKRLLPDLSRCANCTAYATPRCPDIQDDLLQIASIVLIEKGPKFNPTHQSGASFGAFIRPQICGTLRNAKEKELLHNKRELGSFESAWDPYEDPDVEGQRDIGQLPEVPEPHTEFEEALVRDISFQDALPKLLKTLTPREREIFVCLREDQRNCEIAETLDISESRVSQLVTQVTQKLQDIGQKLGLAE